MLSASRHAISPRFTRPPTPLASLLIHGGVLALFALLLAEAFLGHGIRGWSIGIVYIAYDTFLLAFTFWQTLPLRHARPAPAPATRPSLAVIIAAYNEESVLPGTLAALWAQSDPADEIILADDGSTDGTAALLQSAYGLAPPALGGISPRAKLRWLRAPHAGKATALNLALGHIETELFLTVDADTKLAPDAIAAMRARFAATPGLVAATGVLAPHCGPGLSGRLFEWFQTYEYIRNFLGRFAWARQDSLLLISGAFAGFRRDAVITVGGFDPDCMVEDYELIHRLRRYGYNHALNWHSTVLGSARARTSAPATVLGFLRQRRRWFGGFLQTQLWYRDMVGDRNYARLGTWMLPVKAVDTLQPIYGLCAFALLIWYLCTGKFRVLLPAGAIILGKIIIDLAFHIWSIQLYRRWTGNFTRTNMFWALAASIVEPFSFQLLRHLGASWGWVLFLTGRHSWAPRIISREADIPASTHHIPAPSSAPSSRQSPLAADPDPGPGTPHSPSRASIQ
jgi:cellulose synthase/poly-beta-1,6-N-acetylglucosamine synthase-like glycosyltransferase